MEQQRRCLYISTFNPIFSVVVIAGALLDQAEKMLAKGDFEIFWVNN